MIPIISNGHGGMIGGVYQTQGKRSPVWSDGSVLYEGEFNRAIKNRVIEMLHFKDIPFLDLVPEQHDINRKARIARANKFHYQNGRRTFLVDIHSNAGGGHGSEVFISRNAGTLSVALARWSKVLFKKHFPEARFRGIKRKNFDMVHQTAMPAILTENFFMDNEEECKTYLMTLEGRDRIAEYTFDFIETFLRLHS